MNKKQRKVQIDYDLFWKIMLYFLAEHYEEIDSIKAGLEEKLDKMMMHDLYTKYKTADSEEEKEKARQEYLDKVGVPESYRW